MQGATEGWQACQNWVATDGGVNLEFLAEHSGQARIWATASARFEPGCLLWTPWSLSTYPDDLPCPTSTQESDEHIFCLSRVR